MGIKENLFVYNSFSTVRETGNIIQKTFMSIKLEKSNRTERISNIFNLKTFQF